MSVYDQLIDALKFRDEDRAEIKKKRGLVNDIIDKLKFRSLGLHVREVIDTLGVPDTELKKYKILDDEGGINKQLLRPNILIPYISSTGKVLKVRPHKGGFKGDGIAPYSELTLDRKSEELIITEGEFKAAAAFQYGYNCIAIPGISSFCKNYFEDLEGFLAGTKIKKVYILFDREIKDNPEHGNFKKDWKNRYDTEIYSFIMARKIAEEMKLTTLVAELPTAWMIDGKIDIDGALASGRTREDMDGVLADAMPYMDYRKQIKADQKVKNYIWKRTENFFAVTPIIRRDNSYYYATQEKGETKISNFIVNIKASHHDCEDNTLLREVQFINQFGEESQPTVMKPDDMRSKQGFMGFCYNQGNYIFSGTDGQLGKIWESEFMSDEGKHIYTLDHVGKVDSKVLEGQDLWVTKGLMMNGTKEIRSDDDGVFWLG